MTAPWGRYDDEAVGDDAEGEAEKVIKIDLHLAILFIAFALVVVGGFELASRISKLFP